jgi:dTDP-4-amino-4,6-dideoxygalactose transaminase
VAAAHDLLVIADAAHAVGTRIGERHVAQRGDLAAFSFYATKNLSTVEGGALAGRPELLARARLLSRHGLEFEWGSAGAAVARSYAPVAAGYKYNMTDVAAAIGRVQLRRVEELQGRRAAAAAAYDAAIAELSCLSAPPRPPEQTHGNYLYQARVEPPTRAAIESGLRARGVATGFYYRPLHTYPLYASAARQLLTNAEWLASSTIALPLHAGLDDAAIAHVIAALREIDMELR